MFDLIEKFINEHQIFSGGCLAFITSMIRVWREYGENQTVLLIKF